MATCLATCESCVGRCLTQSLEKFALWSSVVLKLSSMLVLKSILWASVDGAMLSAVPQLANIKAQLCFITKFTETSISIVWVYTFQKIYIMRLSLINARDLQLKKHHLFSINTTRTTGHVFSINTTRTSGWCQDEWCIQTVPDPFFRRQSLKKEKKRFGHARLPVTI